MKNALVGLLTDYTQREKKMSVLEAISIETSKTERQIQQKLKGKKEEQNIQGLWWKYKICTMCIMGLLEGKERQKETGEIFEIMTKNFPNYFQTLNHWSRKLRGQKAR